MTGSSTGRRRNGVNDLTKECIGYENGVLGGIGCGFRLLKVLCSNGDLFAAVSDVYRIYTLY